MWHMRSHDATKFIYTRKFSCVLTLWHYFKPDHGTWRTCLKPSLPPSPDPNRRRPRTKCHCSRYRCDTCHSTSPTCCPRNSSKLREHHSRYQCNHSNSARHNHRRWQGRWRWRGRNRIYNPGRNGGYHGTLGRGKWVWERDGLTREVDQRSSSLEGL